MKDEIFYIYVDKTYDGRIFYVGKGKEERLRNTSNRNNYWKGIAAKYGQIREIVLGTRDEGFAFEMEKDLITEYKTFESKWAKGEGWGANFTDGGEGHSGRTGELAARWGKTFSEESKEKLRQAFSGDKNNQYGLTGPASTRFGVKHSEETKRKISESNMGRVMSKESNKKNALSHLGKTHTEEAKRKVSEFNKGKIFSDETKNKLSESLKGHVVSDETKAKIIAAKKARIPLTAEQVIEIREKNLTGNYTRKELAAAYGTSKASITDIVNGKTWKHLKQEKVVKSYA